jgi:hypothetical protein
MERYCTYHERIVPHTIVDEHGNKTKVIDVTHITNPWSHYMVFGNLPWLRSPIQTPNPKRASFFNHSNKREEVLPLFKLVEAMDTC